MSEELVMPAEEGRDEVMMDTSGVMPHLMRRRGNEVIDDYGFCEVPHMAKAYAQGALRRGATAVTLAPYTGWDCIWPFLDAGLIAYVYEPRFTFVPPDAWRRLWRQWQQQARRKYGSGRLLLWPASRGGAS